MNEDELIKKIIDHLRLELPDKMQPRVDEFIELVNKDNMRASYGLLRDILKTSGSWAPSKTLIGLLKAYEVVF